MFFDIGIGIHIESELSMFRFVDDISSKMEVCPVSEILGDGPISCKIAISCTPVLHSEHIVNLCERTGWNNYGIDRRVETDSTTLTVEGVHFLTIISCETRSPKLCVRGWRMYLWIRRSDEQDSSSDKLD
jgi:hypothetical protein